MKQSIILWAVLLSTASLVHAQAWYGMDKENQEFCREEFPHGWTKRGWSKYGNPRRGGVIAGKPFVWYGTYRVWWNGNIPYIRHNKQWQPWCEVYPTLTPPEKIVS